MMDIFYAFSFNSANCLVKKLINIAKIEGSNEGRVNYFAHLPKDFLRPYGIATQDHMSTEDDFKMKVSNIY